MNSPRQDSYTQPYQVGKFYMVPCVKTTKTCSYGGGEFMPVIGPEHTDVEFINFPHSHWHVDWRFVTARALRRSVGHRPEYQVYGIVLHRWAYGLPQYGSLIEGDVVMRRRKCIRSLPQYPFGKAPWMPKLETAFADTRLKGMVCPHKGIPLKGCPMDGDVVTCPGHGLRWNIKTGELVASPCATHAGQK
jgi:hypothetical protein